METFFKPFLYVHVVFGSLSLILGTLIMILKKGDPIHKKLGLVYMWSMVFNGLASLYLAIAHPNNFLFIVGIFSLYMAVSGYRITKMKRIDENFKASAIDWGLSYLILIFGIGFFGLGIFGLTQGHNIGIVSIVFGLISVLFFRNDIQYYTHKIVEKNYWQISHLTKMIGSYIAAFTAFLVVNNTLLPDAFAWLLPTLIGTALIIKWRRSYRKNL